MSASFLFSREGADVLLNNYFEPLENARVLTHRNNGMCCLATHVSVGMLFLKSAVWISTWFWEIGEGTFAAWPEAERPL